ncbi:zinc-binding dehydrogenase [soil metagenome]
MATMRAAVIREHGGYDKVRVEFVPKPELVNPDDVIVRVRACALNRLDLFVRKGVSGPGLRPVHLPRITGVDIAGEVAEVGPKITNWRAGDRVVVYSSLSCGHCPACEKGEDSMCAEYRIFGEDTDGGLAEYCRVGADQLEPLASHISLTDAAALPVAYTTAWHGLKTAQLTATDRVLVLGAGGGVGSAAVQLARRIGAYVFALTRGTKKVKQLQSLGADRVIDRDHEDFETVIRTETNARGVDIVVNPVGGATLRPAIRSLAPGGRMTLCGATIGDSPDISLRELYQSHRQLIGAPMGSRQDFREVLDLLAQGEIKPSIGAVMPLEHISEAHRRLEEGEVFGKLVIEP